MADCYTTTMLAELRRRLEPSGLNLMGVAAVRDYDAAVAEPLRLHRRWPAARVAVVIGSGGSAFWRLAQGSSSPHPLDEFAEGAVSAAVAALPSQLAPLALYPHRFTEAPVSFADLARCAGLGVPSLLGILIRPDFGTWFALRAAILLETDLPTSSPLAFDPCPSCPRPCAAACPGSALDAERGWDVPACAAHRLNRDECADGCHSRRACVYGREHAYPPAEQRHHQAHALAAMRAHAERGP